MFARLPSSVNNTRRPRPMLSISVTRSSPFAWRVTPRKNNRSIELGHRCTWQSLQLLDVSKCMYLMPTAPGRVKKPHSRHREL